MTCPITYDGIPRCTTHGHGFEDFNASIKKRPDAALHPFVHLCTAALVGSALDASPLVAQPSAPIAIRADRLIVGDGTVIEQPVVVIQGDRFVAVGPQATTAIPRGARVITLAGHTLLAGLIDCHTHINSSDSDGGDMAVLRETGAHTAIYGVVNARKTLDAGFTTIRDVGATNGADIALRDLIAKGVVPGPQRRRIAISQHHVHRAPGGRRHRALRGESWRQLR